MRMMEIKAEWEYSNFFLVLWIITIALSCQQVLSNVFMNCKRVALGSYMQYHCLQSVQARLWCSNMNFENKKKGWHVWGFNAFQKKILCLCHIKTCCFWYYLISWLLLAFLTLKNVIDFVRNFVTQTFASPHLSTRWFAKNPIRCLWLLNKEG